MLNSRTPGNSGGLPEGQGLPMVGVLWGHRVGGGQALQNVSMNYSGTETALHRGTPQSRIDLGPHCLPIFSFDIRLKSWQERTGG